MFSNNNKRIIKDLAKKKLKSNKKRYFLLLLSIAISALLLTSTVTVGINMYKSMEYTRMRQVGTSAHGSFKLIDQDQFDLIKDHEDIKKYGKMQTIGYLEGSVFDTRSQQVFYMDENALDFTFILASLEGELPREKNEIIVSDITLKMLELPVELDTKIEVMINVGGITNKETFVVSGIYTGDHLAMADILAVSKEYAQSKLASVEPSNSVGSGLIQMGVMLENDFGIGGDLSQIAREQGLVLADKHFTSNPAYMSTTIQLQDFITFLMLILLLIFSSYLVIYNIFYIGIVHDIQFYGLLKTIGTSGKQVKQMIVKQGLGLSLRAIPVGVISGYLLGIVVFGLMRDAMPHMKLKYSANPLIFVLGALFTLITVAISMAKPGRVASKISPVEAVKINYGSQTVKKRLSKNKKKSTLFRMAKENVTRYKWKAILVVLSITISLVLFQSIYTSTRSMNIDAMIDSMIAGDYTVGNSKLFISEYDEEIAATDKGYLERIEQEKGVSVERIYSSDSMILPSDNLMAQLNIKPDTYYFEESMLLKGQQYVELYGLSSKMMDYLEVNITEGVFDKKAFSTGAYVIINHAIKHFTESGSQDITDIYQVGDQIQLTSDDGFVNSYEIMAMFEDVPYYLYDRSYSNFCLNIYMSEKNFSDLRPNMPIMNASVFVEPEAKEYFSEVLEGLSSQYPNMAFKDRMSYKEELSSFDYLIKVIGYSLSVLLGMIALLNFLNTFVSSIISRKRELAMLQSIGMTSKQLLKMLIYESLIIAASSLGLSVLFGGLLSKRIASGIMYSTGEVSFLPLMIISPIMLLLLSLVPIFTYNNMMKFSLVERMRVVE